jgi:hypothetical protein
MKSQDLADVAISSMTLSLDISPRATNVFPSLQSASKCRIELGVTR